MVRLAGLVCRRLVLGLALAALTLFPTAAHGHAMVPSQVREVTLAQALALMPETPSTRAAGVWYAGYALARHVYGVDRIDSMTDPQIDSFFQALLPLRPGPETGVSALVQGRWRQIYGYDLLQIDGEIYSANAGHGYLGVDVGRLDTAYIGHVLATSGYSATTLLHDRLLVRSATLFVSMPSAALNAVALGPGRVVAGVSPDDVAATSRQIQQGSGTLARDSGYRALAAALGPVQGAFLAANVPPPFPQPAHGHHGAPLHPFGLYALGYQELRPGHAVLEIALDYARPADAAADVPTLRARLQRESLATYGASWRSLVSIASVSARHTVLVARLPLRSSTPPTFWIDAILAHDLSILSQ